ncbi:hypothetical protein [Desulfarculus baarsii]
MGQIKGDKQLANLLADWPEFQDELREAFVSLKDYAAKLPGVVMEFIARPGVSNSLRLDLEPRPAGRQRPLLAMIDAVPMEGMMMLSVCFFADEVDDPEERGDLIPGGLMGSDGYCFDHDGQEPDMTDYLKRRIKAAHAKAVA